MVRAGALALVGMAVLAPASWAQGRGGFGPGGMGMGGGLITNKSVQDELKLSPEQVSKAEAVATKVREGHQGDFQGLRDLSPEERRTKMTEMMRTINAEMSKGLADVLKPEQARRYEQIQLQARGVQALADPDVQKKLGLNDDQKAKIRDIDEATNHEFREIMQANQGDFQAVREKSQASRKAALGKVSALLTDAQKSTWKEMTGEPFEVRFEPPRGGGPGR